MVTKIKLFLSDVDGVLTDGSMYYTESGEEMKRFHTYDGVAFNSSRLHIRPIGESCDQFFKNAFG